MPEVCHLVGDAGARVLDKILLGVGGGGRSQRAILLDENLAILVEPLQLIRDAANLKINLLRNGKKLYEGTDLANTERNTCT